MGFRQERWPTIGQRAGGERLRAGRGRHQQREHEHHARYLARRRDRQPQQREEGDRERLHRQSTRGRGVAVDRREQQRSRQGRERHHGRGRDPGQPEQLRVGDSQQVAEQNALQIAQHAAVETHEQKPHRQSKRLHRSGIRRALAPRAPLGAGEAADGERARAAESEIAPRGGDAEERRAARAGKGHHRERVPGEGLPAQHHHPPHQAGHHGHHAAGQQRVDHEVIFEHLAYVPHDVPANRGAGGLSPHGDRRRRRRAGGGRGGAPAPRAGRRPRGARRRRAAPRSAPRTARSGWRC